MASTKRKAAPKGDQTSSRNNSNRQATQKQVVLKELMEHTADGVTAWDMITNYRITRLSSYICTLKKEGYNIRKVDEPMDNGGHYSRYFYVGGPDELSSL